MNSATPVNGSVKITPKVLIMIATDAIGGPGKGLFQFLKHAPGEAFDYLLCNFDIKGWPVGQFVAEARRRGLNLTLLRQRGTLDPGMIVRARRLVRDHGINVVQTHGYKSNVIGFFLRRLSRMPWIGFSHGYTDDNWKVRAYNRIDAIVLRHADRIVTVSESMKRLLIQQGVAEQKIRVIYNAIETPARPLTDTADVKRLHGIAADRKIVGVIGRLNPEKGQMTFLRALKKTVQGFPAVTAVLIGDGQDRALLERYCQENGLVDHVVFTGYRSNVEDYYSILDLLVLPSLSEGLPNTVLEAMAFGIPVLATRVGGVPEIIDNDNGVLVPPDDPDRLADQMVELLRNDPLRIAIGSKGRDSLHPRFAPDHRARQILGLYHELLRSARATS